MNDIDEKLLLELGRRVRAWRMKLYPSQEEAAVAGGTSVPTWRKVEKGRSDVTDRTYAAIDKAFGWEGGTTSRAAGGQQPLPDWPPPEPVDLYSGAELEETERAHIRNSVQNDVLAHALAMGATIGKSIGRLDLEDLETHHLDPPADAYVLDRTGRRVVIEAKAGKYIGRSQVLQLVGLHTMWQHQGAERMIVFTAVEWPREAVETLRRYGIEYVSSQDQLEIALTVSETDRHLPPL